jgi:conjugative transposon TraN protein
MQKYRLTISLVILLAVGFSASAQVDPNSYYLATIQADTIPVTQSKITCILFPVSIQPAGKGTRDIRAQKVKGTDNVIMIQAVRQNFPSTNLTVVGSNGRLYSFLLKYEPEPSILNFRVLDAEQGSYVIMPTIYNHPVILSGVIADESTLSTDADSVLTKNGFMNHTVKADRMKMTLKGIYIKDQLLWFSIKVSNHSEIDYRADFLNFSIQDKKRGKRTAIQEKQLHPSFRSSSKMVVGKQSQVIIVGLPSFTVPQHKRLVIQIGEPDGGRPLILKISRSDLLKARLL